MKHYYSILVNSSDGYEDCWRPFFHLLKKYWPSCQAKIYLNTEQKEWTTANFPELVCTQVEKKYKRRLTWSECLIAALDQVDTPLVLYFQEDYFIHQPVQHEMIQKSSEYMMQNLKVSHIALTRHCSYGPYEEHDEPWLQTIRQKAKYRMSTQASLWRVDELRSYLNSVENGWMFEIFGTWRAHKRPDTLLCVKYTEQVGGPVIDYLHTGIIKGKWHKDIALVFEKNNLSVNFDKRGFYVPKNLFIHKVEVAQKLLKNPSHFLRQLIKKIIL
jgi:hypothetical protein